MVAKAAAFLLPKHVPVLTGACWWCDNRCADELVKQDPNFERSLSALCGKDIMLANPGAAQEVLSQVRVACAGGSWQSCWRALSPLVPCRA